MEKSESGAPIYRYDEKDANEFAGPSGESSMEEISDHIEKHVGPIEMVFHEIVSNQVHIDIHWVKPTEDKPFHTLITTGMSDKPMNPPPGAEECKFSELVICLPSNWKLSEEDFKDENNYWPLRWLKQLARFPHEFNTWFWWGHTIPNGDPAQPFAENTKMNTMLLLPTLAFGDSFQKLDLPNKQIHFFSLIPLYSEEVKLKMRKGVEALFDGFDEIGVTDILDVGRPSAVKKKKRFGFF